MAHLQRSYRGGSRRSLPTFRVSSPRRKGGRPSDDLPINYPAGVYLGSEFDDLGRLLRFSFEIIGKPAVKKNNQKVRFTGGRPVKYSTAPYLRWEDCAYSQLIDIVKAYEADTGVLWRTIDWRFNLAVRFYMPTFGVVDLSALYEGIQDVMVKHGIIADDSSWLLVSHDGSGVSKDADNPRMVVEITRHEPENDWREVNPRWDALSTSVDL